MRELKGHTGKLRAVVFSPDGSRLATAGDAGVTKLWDVSSGEELATIRQPDADSTRSADQRRVGRLAFSPDGKLLATATRRIRLWDASTAAEVPFPDGLGESRDLTMAFTPDGALLIVTRTSSIVHSPHLGGKTLAWNRKANKFEEHFVQKRDLPEGVATSASADLVAIAQSDFSNVRVRLWGLTSKELQTTLDLTPTPLSRLRSTVHEVAFSPDGRTLAVAAGMMAVVWDVPERVRGCLEGHLNTVSGVAFAPGGRLLATAGHDGTVRFWDVESLDERASYDWGFGKARSVAFSPDGRTAAAVGDKSKVVIWDLE